MYCKRLKVCAGNFISIFETININHYDATRNQLISCSYYVHYTNAITKKIPIKYYNVIGSLVRPFCFENVQSAWKKAMSDYFMFVTGTIWWRQGKKSIRNKIHKTKIVRKTKTRSHEQEKIISLDRTNKKKDIYFSSASEQLSLI